MLPRTQRRRAGFTLIELLVVIFIIAVLAALTAGTIFKFWSVQPVSNTKAELKLLQTALHKKWMEVTDLANSSRDDANYKPHRDKLLDLARGNPDVARVIWVKIRQKQAFPQTFFEALNPIILGTRVGTIKVDPLPAYVNYLNKYGITTGDNANPKPYESAVCLLMALRRNVSGGGEISEDTFGVGTFISSINVLAGRPQVPYLVDAWKNPILFCRWPLGSTVATVADPADPQNLLGRWQSLVPTRRTCSAVGNPSCLPPKSTRSRRPCISSARHPAS
jgi:prepilin-type N-terminal cleavage/methylation domain-containing protein